MATRSIRRLVIGGTLGAVLAMIASGLGSVAVAADHGVNIAGFAFSPDTITIAVGDSVTWSNGDSVSHTATADDASFDTGTIGAGTSKSVTFSTAGTFAYHCRIHSSMTATVVVSDAATPPATDTLTAAATHSDGTPIMLLMLAAFAGLVIGRRRFAGSVASADR
jgi:plastocyanin